MEERRRRSVRGVRHLGCVIDVSALLNTDDILFKIPCGSVVDVCEFNCCNIDCCNIDGCVIVVCVIDGCVIDGCDDCFNILIVLSISRCLILFVTNIVFNSSIDTGC